MRKNQKNKRSGEFTLYAVNVKFNPLLINDGRDYKLVGGLAITVNEELPAVPWAKIGDQIEIGEIMTATPRFNPRPNVEYVCDVKVRVEKDGLKAKGRATPVREVRSMLSDREWTEDTESANTVELSFKKGRSGKPIAFFKKNGNPVFPARGTEVVLGQRRVYLLLERDGFMYHAVLAEGTVNTNRKGNGKRNLNFVDIRVPKPVGATAESEEELSYSTQRKSVWEVLDLSKDTATPESVRKACEKKLARLGVGTKRHEKKAFILRRYGECFAEAVEQACAQALEILGVTAEEPETTAIEEDIPEVAAELVQEA